MIDREEIKNTRNLLIRNILAGQRPDPDEMLLMSQSYQQVWRDVDSFGESIEESTEDWTNALDL